MREESTRSEVRAGDRVSTSVIAAGLGISRSTVRRAFGDPGKVKEETRRRILQAAQELGYRPNPLARRLALGTQDIVGLTIAHPMGDDGARMNLMHRYVSLIDSLNQLLEARNLHLMLGQMSRVIAEREFERELPAVIGGGYCEHLVVLNHMWPDLASRLNQARVTAIVVDGPACGLPAVQRDEIAAMETMVDYLVELGHRRIAFINTWVNSPVPHYREEDFPKGYFRAITRHRLVPMPGWDKRPEYDERFLRKLMDMPKRPTAIIAYDEPEANYIKLRLKEWGIRVPGDVSLCTMIKLIATTSMHETSSCVSFPHEEAAQAVVEMISRSKEVRSTGTEVIRLNGQVVVGNTAGPVSDGDSGGQ